MTAPAPAPAAARATGDGRAWLAFAACSGIWGSTFLVISIGNDVLAPLWSCTLRLVLAALLLGAWTRLRGQALPWAAAGLALAGNVLFGFAVACVVRTRTGEPGAVAGTAVVLVLMTPSLVPQVARWVRTFPAPRASGLSSDTLWWTVLAVCVVAIVVSVGSRNLPPWMSTVPMSRRRRSYPTVQPP